MQVYETTQQRGSGIVVLRLLLLFFLSLSFVLFTGCGTTQTAVLQGTVSDTYTGEPVEAQIRIDQVSLEADTDGFYRTTDWSPEDTLEISAPGYATERISLESYDPSESSDDTLTVTLETELRPTTLTGVVSDAYSGQPVEGARVSVEVPSRAAEADTTAPEQADIDGVEIAEAAGFDVASSTDTEMLTFETDKSGHYELEGLPEEFTLVVDSPDHAPLEVELERTTQYDAALQPDVLGGQVTDRYSGEPLEGVKVTAGKVQATTDAEGRYTLEGINPSADTVIFETPGYAAVERKLDRSTRYDPVLRPDVLESTLVNGENGEPVEFATVIATQGLTSTAVASVRIDNSPDGRFVLDGLPETGYVQVLAPGYRKAMLEIVPGNIPSQIELEPFKARALYVKTTTAAYMPDRMKQFFDLIDTTELNALVIDLKSDNLADLGLIYYDSQVPIVQELGTSADLMDIEGILAEARSRNIYTIARIHVFAHDNLLAETRPDWAAQNAKGCVPNENRLCNGDVFYADWDIAWLDPWNRNVWDYNIQLGIEAAQMGFDEVQFDYIRFPNDAREIEFMRLSKPIDWRNNPEPMYENIATFMEQAHAAINGVGAFFSVDIFGYAIWSPQANIGQNAEYMAPHADYICPMVYPSHFWTNELGFENAAAHPYEIVYESLEFGHEMVGDKRARMRPWLQDFTLIWVPDPLIVRYGVDEVRAQIQAVEDSPYGYGWAMWDPDNEYTIEAYR